MRIESRWKRDSGWGVQADEAQDSSEAENAGRSHQSLGDRADRDARDVHGSAGHFDRERRAAAHFRKFVRERGRIHLGSNFVLGIERDRAASVGLVFVADWT